MSEELPRSKGDALLDRLMQLRMLYEKEHEVYDAAMAVWSALRGELIHPEYGGFGHEVRNEHDHTEETLDLVDELDAACRRAKEGHG